jgi:hypothetical protein
MDVTAFGWDEIPVGPGPRRSGALIDLRPE